MAKKEEGPLEYERRILDTKAVAQRLILGYLKRPVQMLVQRKKITWILVAVSAAACVPLVLGIGGKKVLSTGPLSASHAVFEGRCEVCHAQAFRKVPDQACEKCHDGAAHPANLVDTAKANVTVRCAECHVEHGGQAKLGMVGNGNCTRCHANLEDHAMGVKIKGVKVSAFREEKHPEFLTASMKDARPFLLNHKKHMDADPKKFPRIMKEFMKCVDCHKTDLNSRNGDLIPMTFEASCKSCHKRELQFDRYQVLGESAMESPHTRDQNTIRQFIEKAYREALAANPGMATRPLGFDNSPQPSAEAWVTKVTTDSYEFLFGQKCTYCHKMESQYEVMKVDPRPPQSPTAPVQAPLGIKGRYPEGKDWFERSEFSHRAHREVECESCHTAAKGSMKTEDVLIPVMKSCLPCHGESRASLDRCSECHLYHNRSLEKERDRRPTDNIIGWLPTPPTSKRQRTAEPRSGGDGRGQRQRFTAESSSRGEVRQQRGNLRLTCALREAPRGVGARQAGVLESAGRGAKMGMKTRCGPGWTGQTACPTSGSRRPVRVFSRVPAPHRPAESGRVVFEGAGSTWAGGSACPTMSAPAVELQSQGDDQ